MPQTIQDRPAKKNLSRGPRPLCDDRDMATYLCTADVFLRHRPLGEHPERPERLARILEALDTSDLRSRCKPLPARPATSAELTRVHTEDYIWDLEKRKGLGFVSACGW